MSDDERQWTYASSNGVGDSFTVAFGRDYYGSGEQFQFTLDEPWAGDTETGFGRTCPMDLPLDDAVNLARWILQKAEQAHGSNNPNGTESK